MKTIFFDVDTQIDFMFPAGALYVPGAERIIGAVSKLNRYAAAHGFPVISTTDAHDENDPEFLTWPPHCIVGTVGQLKPASTLLDRRSRIHAKKNGGLDAVDLTAPQILLEKQRLDCFTNPLLEDVLQRIGAGRFVVYGVVTEICVRFAAFGLLKTGKRVELVKDAVQSLKAEDAGAMLQEFVAAGGALTTVAEVCG